MSTAATLKPASVKITEAELVNLTAQAVEAMQEFSRRGEQFVAAQASVHREQSDEYFHERVPRALELLNIEQAASRERHALWEAERERRSTEGSDFLRAVNANWEANLTYRDQALALGQILVNVKTALSAIDKTFVSWRSETYGPDPEKKIENRCDYCLKRAHEEDATSAKRTRPRQSPEELKARKESIALEAIRKRRAVQEKAEEMRRRAEESKAAEDVARAERLEKRLQKASRDAEHRIWMVEKLDRERVKAELDSRCYAIHRKLVDMCSEVISGEEAFKSGLRDEGQRTYGDGSPVYKNGLGPLDVKAFSQQLRMDFSTRGNTLKQDIDELVEKVLTASYRKPFGEAL